jgi:hypothetical protein
MASLLAANGTQVDLTDDYVVMALFGDGAWEENMQRLQVSAHQPLNPATQTYHLSFRRQGNCHLLVSVRIRALCDYLS